MFIDQILGSIVARAPSKQVKLAKPCSDHRLLKEGDVFVAIEGTSFDGHSVLTEVLFKKPAAIIIQKEISVSDNIDIPIYKVTNSRFALDKLAHAYFQFPSQKLYCVGVTGTNGKTTTTHMIEHVLAKIGRPAGVIGTIDHHFKDTKWKTEHTSPGPLEFYERLSQFVNLGARALAVETTSHALDQDRMSSCEFDVAVFTNLTLDHLDYHKTMENYFEAKQKFFLEILESSSKKNKFAIINVDDSWGQKIKVGKSVKKITYGQGHSDLRFQVLIDSYNGQKIKIWYNNESIDAELQVPGLFNAYNFMATIGVLLSSGVSLNESVDCFRDFFGVKGRLEKIQSSNSRHVFVDYAHTPDALENVLNTLKSLQTKNRIITVFGCGGDRDKSKRPIMAQIAEKLSDFVFVTSDNPRTEDPQIIINDILAGMKKTNYESVVDRKSAIKKSIEFANPGDVVLIAGKGHEDYQIIGKTRNYFSDSEIAREFLK